MTCLIFSIRGNKDYLNLPQHFSRRNAKGNRGDKLEPLQGGGMKHQASSGSGAEAGQQRVWS